MRHTVATITSVATLIALGFGAPSISAVGFLIAFCMLVTSD